MKHNS